MMRRMLALFLMSALTLPAAAVPGKRPDFRPRPCQPSKRFLLSSAESAYVRSEAGTRASGFSLRKEAAPVRSSKPDTLRVLGLMVQFRQDLDPETTGDGRFMLEPVTGVTIDPPPHDHLYFKNQLRALTHYWRAVSGGKLVLEFEVARDVLTVADSLGAYIPPESSRSDEAVTAGVVRFFRDAVRRADAAGVRFSDFDCLIVFHAGVGGDLAFDYDPTPRDMPSMFLNLDDLKDHLPASEFNETGLSVENGAHGVMEGIVLPETQSQEGYEIGLLGTAALMFGFQLGLPALWNTETGSSGIGAWGLMDQGSGNYNGLIPARPSAIERMLLGWEDPYEAGDRSPIQCACPAAAENAEVGPLDKRPVLVPIAGGEFYLIENRQHDPDGDGVALGLDAEGGTVTFGADYQVHFTGNPSVIVSVDEYDYGLPGSGLLIWHVDESVLLAGLEDNTVNANPLRRGVDLEEADGSQDIGESYGMFDAGSGSETGVLQDAWYADNDIHKLVNRVSEVAFTPSSHPNTRSNDGADSHLSLYGFSESGPVMTFSVRNDRMHADFPRFFPVGSEPFPPLSCDLNGDGIRDAILVTKSGAMYGWDQAGYFESWPQAIPIPWMPNWVPLWNLMHPLGVSVGAFSVPPACGDLNGDGADEIVLLTEDRGIQILMHDETEQPAKPRVRLNIPMEAEKGTALVLAESSPGSFRPLIGTESGRIVSFDMTGSLSEIADPFDGPVSGLSCWGSEDTVLAVASNGAFALLKTDGSLLFSGTTGDSGRFGPVTGVFAAGSGIRAILPAEAGFHLFDASGSVTEWGRPDSDGTFGSTSLADVNGDGSLDIVSVSGGRVWCMNLNGTLIEGFPARIAAEDAECSTPIIGDVDGDGHLDILVSTSEGVIEAVSADGGRVEGFPLPLYGRKAVAPTLADLDGDGRIEILAASDGGQMTVWDMDGSAENLGQAWPMARHDAAGSGRSQFIPGVIGPAPSGGLLPARHAYNYPNPAYDDFTVIRYRLREAGRVRITVYSLAGAEIAAFEAPGDAPGDHEAVWSLKGVDSGVYTCRIHASASGESGSAFFKIAVVK
ncbi:MAG: T9SS type A sorting domain-containing protein [bacterium]|nr:T9SS type A sorting domain-containing protein [bacterium]